MAAPTAAGLAALVREYYTAGFYATGAQVTFGGHTYRCRQSHTSLSGWEPPNVPALWLLVS